MRINIFRIIRPLFFGVGILFFCTNSLIAQQYPLFTNFVVNAYGYNPAAIGTLQHTELRGTYRSQWLGVEGRPQTALVTLNGRLGKSNMSVGGTFHSDQLGRISKTGGMLNLGYTQKMGDKAGLTLGLSGGFYSWKLLDKVFIQNELDPIVSNAQLGKLLPDISFGVLYHQQDGLMLGVSVPQLYRKEVFFDPSVSRVNTTEIVRQYHGMVGYDIKLNDKISFQPAVLAKLSPSVPTQFDFAVRAFLDKKFWIGGSFRTEDAMTAMLGVDMKRWMIAYSYDMTISELSNKSAGSHEITLALRFIKDKCPDEDKDGICDKEDKCPKEPGTKEKEGCPEKKVEEKCPDKDKDSICDAEDDCPELPGPKSNKGCPTNDRDGDGVRDDVDKCPDIPGAVKNEGCPLSDRDRDGILDEVDPCPDVPGTLDNMGCPPENDRDKDGTPDKNDPCPDVEGPKSNKGCPENGDRDKDGVPDDKDGCPNTFGLVDNNGCPRVTQEERDILNLAIRNVYFDTDKSIVRPSSFRDLNNVARILKQKKDWKIKIEGHADSRGSVDHNVKLSENRSEAVKNYLVSKGVPPNLILLDFHGETRPAIPEKDKTGLQMNRRVEIEFVFD